MAVAGRMTGKDLYATFGGTVLSGDFTSVSVAEEADLEDVTAGAETVHYYLFTRADGTVDLEAYFNMASGGSAERAVMDPGDSGTLIIGPRGTTSTYPRWTCARALVKTRRMDYPFETGARMRVSFQFSAAWTEDAYD